MELSASDLVLVTGATGLVGSHVAEGVRELGVPTRAVARAAADAGLLRSWGVDGLITDHYEVLAPLLRRTEAKEAS